MSETHKNCKIGFVINNSQSYWQVMASTRLRCYDVMRFLNNNHFIAELYNKEHKYELVIFQKCFKNEHIKLAKSLKRKGIIVILDMNVNYIDKDSNSEFVTKEQNENIRIMLGFADHLLVSSPMLAQIYSKFHSSIYIIEEGISSNFFTVKKHHVKKDLIYLLFCGYSVKAKEILNIRDVLVQLHKDFGIKILYITDKDPEIKFIPYRFLKYDQKNLPSLLLQGDIKIAPRDLKNPYNLGHSFIKVAYPMAVGIPAIASPVPSYINRNVILCDSGKEWFDSLSMLINNSKLREFYGEKGRDFVKSNFSASKIGNDYIRLLNYLTNNK